MLRFPRTSVAVAVAVTSWSAPVAHAAPAKPPPLLTPVLSVRLVTTDPVAVLQRGRFTVRVTARRTASLRLAAFTRDTPLAGARTVLIRARTTRSRTLTLTLSAQARRRLSSCATTSIVLRVKARGYGSPRLTTGRRPKVVVKRFAFVCRGGKLVAQPSAVAAPPAFTGPVYEVGLAGRSIATEADGTWKGEPVFLGGYGFGGGAAIPDPSGMLAGRPATGVLGEGPSVRAMVVGDGETTAAVADVEVQGWFAARREDANGIVDMRKAIEKATGGALPASRVVIQSDHSHSGADVMGVWGGVPADFVAHMRKQTETAILEAWFNRRPGRLFYGRADGKDLLTNQFDFDAANRTQDSDVRVLQARDPAGTPFATLLNFSAHSTVLGEENTRISGDWPQAANRLMAARKDARGRPVFGAAMTVIGTFGRTQPERGGDACKGRPEGSEAAGLCRIDDYATKVVARAQAALTTATPLAGPPVVAGSSYLIQDAATNAPILGFSTFGPTAGAAVGLPFNRSAQAPWQVGPVIGTVTGTLRIGDVLLSSVPGEIYPQVALAVSDTVKGIRPGGFMTAGLADDQLGYIIAPYEAYPEPIRRTFLSQDGGDVTPLGNDNYFFNVSHTLGERVVCSLLRGADDVFDTRYRENAVRCTPFANDALLAPGSDVTLSGRLPAGELP